MDLRKLRNDTSSGLKHRGCLPIIGGFMAVSVYCIFALLNAFQIWSQRADRNSTLLIDLLSYCEVKLMEIDLTTEDQQIIDGLLAQGRFASASEVIAASLTFMQAEAEWKKYAQQRIDAGVEAAERGDFASESDVDSLFAGYQRKSA
jgi:putative addiction module CopG family antidote